MAITAASVEASGWVLRLDVTGSLGSFASYTLDPGGTPRITLASSHAGFVKSGGQAVSGSLARSLIATRALRKPANWNGSSLDAAVIDETDLGGATIRVRIALSEHIYATDTGLSLAVLAGWRTGESATSGVSVTNNSTCVAPIPILRWALLPYQVTTGAFTVALFVASHHPVGFEPVAGVKFTATDGTTVKTVWTTSLSTDTSLGDGLRCYTASIDPATATALTAGLLRIDAEVYPWLGSMRTTDAAGTRSMANLRADGISVDAASPFTVGYDPAGTRYNNLFVYVDPVNGTTTASAGQFAGTLAAAKAVAPASRAKDINTALQACYLANRTLAAANGQSSQTRSGDGLQIVLAPGTHAGPGSTAVTVGFANNEMPVRIVGDPADSDPRTNCILQTGANTINRASRFQFQNLRLEIGGTGLNGGTINLLDSVSVTARSGQTASTVQPFTASPFSGTWNMGLTRTIWTGTAVSLGGGNTRIGVLRNCNHAAVASFIFAVKNTLQVSASVFQVYTGWPSSTIAGQVEDIVVAWNDLRSTRGRAWAPAYLSSGTAGTPNASLRRNVFLGNIVERIGSDTSPFYGLGEDGSATMSYNIIEGNTFVGDRSNTFYSDPLPTTVGETNTLLNQAFVNRVANNAFDWLPTKHDDFNDPQTATLRGTANGYRPQMIEAWSMLYGVCHEANVDTRRGTAGSPNLFALQYSGPRSLAGYSASFSPLYTDDKSILGPSGASAVGGGDYRLQGGSPLVSRVLRTQADVDFAGVTRRSPSAAGAYETTDIALAVNSASFALAGAPSALLAPASLATSGATFGTLASQVALSATPQITLSPRSVALGTAVQATTLTASGTLAGAGVQFAPSVAAVGIVAGAGLVPASISFSTAMSVTELVAENDNILLAFRTAFPAFNAVPDDTVTFWLTRAARSVDSSWTADDRDFALWLLAAHLMTEQGLGTGAEAEMAAAGAGGFRVMKSGSLTLERDPASTGGGAYATTAYGRQFAVLFQQNKGGARVTDGGELPIDPFGTSFGRMPGW